MFLDLVYPPGLYCISCGKITDSSRTYGLCNDCMKAVNWITERHCSKCGRPLAETDRGPLCFGCTATERSVQPHAFDKGHACAGYGAAEQALIFAFKYGAQSHIGDILGEIMYDRMTAEYDPVELRQTYDMVVPIPIHREKKKRRGFNQAELMARPFSKLSGIRCESELLIRTKATKAMKELNREERRLNIDGAFELRERKKKSIQNASLLLVDDILTTGATLNEAAAILKAAGASRVDFLVFAGGADIILT